MDTDEQWRRLFADDIDVIPIADSIHRQRFAGMESVRISWIPTRDYLGIFFNARAPELASPRVRRAIVRGIDRRAIAQIACGDAACADTLWSVDTAADERVQLPATLRAIYLASDYGAELAGRTLRHQLRALGIQLQLDGISIDEVMKELPAGSFHLGLFPMNRSYLEIFTSDHVKNYTGYANPDFDRAVAAGDFAAADRILARDVPIYPLFELISFSAVDRKFCGPGPQTVNSWRWVADLYLCERGAPP
jgi:ABC-type oligopeptide transport system substrate-binding subunit